VHSFVRILFLWRQGSLRNLRGDQEGLFKLVTLDRILNRITGVTSGCWWLVVVNAIPISDICQINQQNISSCSVIRNPIKKCS
jgi:MFS-type transporter involved in bile tolerance (Atg22 family)